MAKFGQTALTDGLIAGGVAFFTSPTWAITHCIVGVVLGLVAIIGPWEFVSEIMQVFGDMDRAHQLFLDFLAFSNFQAQLLNLFLDQ